MDSRLRWLVAALFLSAAPVLSAEWTWTYEAAPDAQAPQVEVARLKYDKDWAYAVEIDDGPKGTLTVIQPLFARYHHTDAPPGVAGGKPLPFVGGTAPIVSGLGTANSTRLDWDDIRQLQARGWSVINHSYAHQGRTWGNPPEILSPEQIRRDLFWSQTILATEVGNGRAPTHMVYPNGYTGYQKHMAEFGLRSGSLVGRLMELDLYGEKLTPYELGRAYLDSKPWAERGKSEPLHGFPKQGPKRHFAHIDFTHGINKDPESDSYKRWVARLSAIESAYGAAGADTMWSASTGEIFDYVAAARNAKLEAQPGRIRVVLPDEIPGSALTLRIRGIPDAVPLTAPEGTVLHRQDGVVWLTTPVIGEPGAPAPAPAVRRLYSGALTDLTWEKPVRIAAVRILQNGPVADGFVLRVEVEHDDTVTSLVRPGQETLGRAWGAWRLLNRVPEQDPVMATALRLTQDKNLGRLEVWVMDDPRH